MLGTLYSLLSTLPPKGPSEESCILVYVFHGHIDNFPLVVDIFHRRPLIGVNIAHADNASSLAMAVEVSNTATSYLSASNCIIGFLFRGTVSPGIGDQVLK